ncbi:MAG: transglycosylase SLT domain-containing protein [Anaerolineales bacterium]|nr:transglycosylase SLT domain-containing protein [Anaerolineales bacterium]
MRTQHAVIRLLPLEVFFLGGLALGWTLFRLEEPLWAEAPPALAGPVTSQAEAGEAAALPGAGLAPVFTAEVQHWSAEIQRWAGAFSLDPNLVATVMQIESCGWPQAVSASGAQGLFQVMPFHFAVGEAMQDPDTNAGRGLAYLALGLQRAGGDVGRALAGYNGGHSQIGKDPSLWPAQTQRYWYWGSGIYAEAAAGQPTSGRLEEWLASGGASLCAHARQALGLAP